MSTKRIKWMKATLVVCILFLLQGCQSNSAEQLIPLEKSTIQSSSSAENIVNSSSFENSETYNTVDDARELIYTAFGTSVTNIAPEVSDPFENLKSISFIPDPNNLNTKFVVQFQDNYAYPYCVYYFHHALEDDVDIATDADFSFDTAAIYKASDFIKALYEVDVSDASVRAYGYKNKPLFMQGKKECLKP